MKSKIINIEYIEYNSIDELGSQYNRLVEKAIEAAKYAYAPYSNFKVGAALLMKDNTIITGNNQENAAYPSGLCAERVALFYAKSINPDNVIVALAIIAIQNNEITDYPVSPCGSCRQVIAEVIERQKNTIVLILAGKNKVFLIPDALQLLPLKFSFVKEK
ncbi:MAG: cytidine deaminase [Bacteroidales bacterium]|nr:cytidine deaminase [Bacteroidales bacterium]